MTKVYRIKDWDTNFEVADTRKCANMKWIAVPNRQEGKGYRRIASHARSCEIFAAWILICQVASKMPERGLLVDKDGPLDAEDMGFKTGFPAEAFEIAFEVLVADKIEWLEVVPG